MNTVDIKNYINILSTYKSHKIIFAVTIMKRFTEFNINYDYDGQVNLLI